MAISEADILAPVGYFRRVSFALILSPVLIFVLPSILVAQSAKEESWLIHHRTSIIQDYDQRIKAVEEQLKKLQQRFH